ncbi:O-antigen ligase family protein [Candidatus Gottesmanbacteria bacterium]|nr:O-antigen ligase family protein [Candidatus Gottesmanbacteria bacterium]
MSFSFYYLRVFFASIRRLTRENTGLSIFFFFLTTSLFLGDGKQPFVDAWWALGILMMYGIRYYQRGKLDLRPLPRSIGYAWISLILYYIILIPFSDSAGYSITATIRLIEAYLVYVMFATISFEKTITLFTKGLLFVGVVATLASFVFLLAPSWTSFLPPMNLLYATYGHNHLADLLLFVFPVAIGVVEKKRTVVSVGLLALFTIGMLLTFARGAWILLVFYLLFLVWRSKNVIARKVGLFVAAVIITTFLLVSFAGIPTQKPSLLADGRWEYWRQAVEAIKERPLFGSGPGTFYLQSKRLQEAPASFSWFVHSFPLQLAVETGAVGFLIFAFLFYSLLRRIKTTSPLLTGAALVFAYGFYEFTLDYTVMWLLVLAALGALTEHRALASFRVRLNTISVAPALGVLILFYLSSVGSLGASILGYPKLAFLFAPHDENAVKVFLGKQKKKEVSEAGSYIPMITFYHRRHPDILMRFAQNYNDAQNTMAAREYYELAKYRDPYNEEYQRIREKFYLHTGEFWLFFNEYKSIIYEKHPDQNPNSFNEIVFANEDIAEGPRAMLNSQIQINSYSHDETSINLFLLGFALVDTNPLATKQLFTVARDISPTWSYFHLALSSYYHYYEDQKELAQDVLKNCLRYEYAGDHCADVIKLSIPTLNEIKDYVLTMP